MIVTDVRFTIKRAINMEGFLLAGSAKTTLRHWANKKVSTCREPNHLRRKNEATEWLAAVKYIFLGLLFALPIAEGFAADISTVKNGKWSDKTV